MDWFYTHDWVTPIIYSFLLLLIAVPYYILRRKNRFFRYGALVLMIVIAGTFVMASQLWEISIYEERKEKSRILAEPCLQAAQTEQEASKCLDEAYNKFRF